MSAFKIIDPITVDDTNLDSTNVAETVSAYSATSYYLDGDTVRSDTTHKVYEALVGNAGVTVTMTVASPCVVTHNAHGYAANTPVAFSTTGALPTGLTANTVYYVLSPTTNSYNVSATPGGAVINTSGTQSGTHTEHANPNRGNDPTNDANAAYWLDTGATNPWAMFDEFLESQTSNADTIETSITPATRADAAAFFNVDASTITIVETDPTDGEVYNETFNLVNNINVSDYYDYCFEPVIRKTELLVDDLPPYAGATLDITIDNTGGTAKCGLAVVGSARTFGQTVYGASTGIIDASVKATDDFGRTTITQRSYRKTATFPVVIAKVDHDEVNRVLAERRAVFSVFAGAADDYSSTLIYGFPKSWETTIEQPLQSRLQIEIEGVS